VEVRPLFPAPLTKAPSEGGFARFGLAGPEFAEPSRDHESSRPLARFLACSLAACQTPPCLESFNGPGIRSRPSQARGAPRNPCCNARDAGICLVEHGKIQGV
jgi:hypothetical protein